MCRIDLNRSALGCDASEGCPKKNFDSSGALLRPVEHFEIEKIVNFAIFRPISVPPKKAKKTQFFNILYNFSHFAAYNMNETVIDMKQQAVTYFLYYIIFLYFNIYFI